MKNKVYINIEPLGYYFFGGENTFDTKQVSKHEKEVKNYFAVSKQYPQQTTLFGLLRYMCLVIKNKLDATDKSSIIGDNFDVENERNNKGDIFNISPIVIAQKQGNSFKFLTPKPFYNQNGKEITVGENKSMPAKTMYVTKTSFDLSSNFDYKKFETLVEWIDEYNKIINPFGKSLTKAGVWLKKNRAGEEDAYYKQTFQKLEKDFSFGVWVNFNNDDVIQKLTEIIIPFGADQGLFKISIHHDIEDVYDLVGEFSNTIYLNSDAFVTAEIYQYIDFGLTEAIDFRFIKSKKSNYYNLNNNDDKSDKYSLLSRGSVLYCNDSTKVLELLEKENQFREIGYNYYKFIN